MLANGATADALEKGIIEDYNSQLAARIAAFESGNDGVRDHLTDRMYSSAS